MKALLWSLMCSVLLLVACGQVGEDEVPGVYVASYAGGSDQLTLLPSGKYTHVLSMDDGSVVSSGKWVVETLSGEDVGITFDDFQFRVDAKSLKPAGVWHVRPRKSPLSGDVKLCFDPDLGTCFVKK